VCVCGERERVREMWGLGLCGSWMKMLVQDVKVRFGVVEDAFFIFFHVRVAYKKDWIIWWTMSIICFGK